MNDNKEILDDIGVSIIVPVYNTQDYLPRCIESILLQTYGKIEVILVDDGSIDNSGVLCEKYAKHNRNLRVIHKKNEGLVRARLDGVIASKYEYITFVDSDDYVAPTLVEKLVEEYKLNKAEMVASGMAIVRGNRIIRNNGFAKCGNFKLESIANSVFDDEINGGVGLAVSMCGKLFLRDLLISTITQVKETLTYGEDLAELLLYLDKISSISLLDEWDYFYVEHEESMSHSITLTNYEKIKKLYDFLHSGNNELISNTALLEQASLFIRYLIVETTASLFPGINMGFISFVPPYELIPQGCKLLVYGMGLVGKSYLKCLLSSRYADVVGCIDTHLDEFIHGIHIDRPTNILNYDFDYILIAVDIEDYWREMMNTLHSLGISDDQVIWKRPYHG